MLSIFNRNQRTTEALIDQATGAQSVLYRMFKDLLQCSDDSIQKLELSFLSLSVLEYVYLLKGKGSNKAKTLERVVEAVLLKSLPFCGRTVPFAQALSEYHHRREGYFRYLDLITGVRPSTSGSPWVTMMMDAYESVTGRSAAGEMIRIAASGQLIVQLIADDADFIRTL